VRDRILIFDEVYYLLTGTSAGRWCRLQRPEHRQSAARWCGLTDPTRMLWSHLRANSPTGKLDGDTGVLTGGEQLSSIVGMRAAR
jgi:hypothetical protein